MEKLITLKLTDHELVILEKYLPMLLDVVNEDIQPVLDKIVGQLENIEF